MKLIFRLVIIISLAIEFTSCQKEVDWGLNTVSTNDTVYLKKYVELDTTLASGSDTTLIRDFQYDASKRLVKIVDQEIDHVHSITTLEVFKYFYSGTGTNPYMVIDSLFDGMPRAIDTIWLFYDANNQVIKDTTISYVLSPANLYQKSANSYNNSGNNTFIQTRDSIYSFPRSLLMISIPG